MKSNLKKILSILLIFILTITLASCTGFTLIDDDDDNGSSSSSKTVTEIKADTPYNEAVVNGFNGSYEQWILSLFENEEYDNLYEAYKAQGYTGTFEDFLDSFKAESTDLTEASTKGLKSSVTIQSKYTSEWDKTTASYGSGVIIPVNDNDKENGIAYIITNYHVCTCEYAVYKTVTTRDFFGRVTQTETISEYKDAIATEINVNLFGMNNYYDQQGNVTLDQSMDAVIVGMSSEYDIAVLKIQDDRYKNSEFHEPCEIGDSNAITQGMQVLAIGNAEAEGISVTTGIISNTFETINIGIDIDGSTQTLKEIRIDAAINPGNSGGGLFDTNGKLIGIVNAKSMSELTEDRSGKTVIDDVEGMGYALPINYSFAVAKRIIKQCSGETKSIKKPVLGITVQIQKTTPVVENGLVKVNQLIAITEIGSSLGYANVEYTESSVTTNGFEVGDIIVSGLLNNKEYKVTSKYSVEEILLDAYTNDVITFTVQRTVNQTLVTRKVKIRITSETAVK